MYLEIGGWSKPQSGLTIARIFRSSGRSRSLISDVAGHMHFADYTMHMALCILLQSWKLQSCKVAKLQCWNVAMLQCCQVAKLQSCNVAKL